MPLASSCYAVYCRQDLIHRHLMIIVRSKAGFRGRHSALASSAMVLVSSPPRQGHTCDDPEIIPCRGQELGPGRREDRQWDKYNSFSLSEISWHDRVPMVLWKHPTETSGYTHKELQGIHTRNLTHDLSFSLLFSILTIIRGMQILTYSHSALPRVHNKMTYCFNLHIT